MNRYIIKVVKKFVDPKKALAYHKELTDQHDPELESVLIIQKMSDGLEQDIPLHILESHATRE